MRLRHAFTFGVATLVFLLSVHILQWSKTSTNNNKNNILLGPQEPSQRLHEKIASHLTLSPSPAPVHIDTDDNSPEAIITTVAFPDNNNNPSTQQRATEHNSNANCDFYRYQHIHLMQDTKANRTASHAFFYRALGEALDPSNDCQVIVGRNAIYESRIMFYPTQTYPKPLEERWYVNPGFYFTTEQTDKEKLGTVKQWAKAWKQAFQATNLFTVFDWNGPKHVKMKQAVERYATRAGQLHTTINEPPCLAGELLAQEGLTPWTAQLRNKTVLIVHPFVDTMQQNRPQLHQIWAQAQVHWGLPVDECFPQSTHIKYIRPPMHQHREDKTEHPARLPWMDVLADLKQQINAVGHFDMALLGCGGFGLPLVHHIASLPHKPSAMYNGGVLQLFFGILGGRWTTVDGQSTLYPYHNNTAWTWPLPSDIGNSTVGRIEKQAYIKPKGTE